MCCGETLVHLNSCSYTKPAVTSECVFSFSLLVLPNSLVLGIVTSLQSMIMQTEDIKQNKIKRTGMTLYIHIYYIIFLLPVSFLNS